MQYLLCRWSNETFAVNTFEIQEMLRMVQVTHLPSEADRVDGLLNYRGEMIPVIDSCRLFMKPSQAFDTESLIVVLNYQEHSMALVAHEPLELYEVDKNQVKVQDPFHNEFFDAVLQLNGTLYPILNPARLKKDTSLGEPSVQPNYVS